MAFTKVFDREGDFSAFYEAVAWLTSMGYSIGSMQRDAPIGVMAGDWSIAKWRNLSAAERAELDGTITGSKRSGPVTVTLNREPMPVKARRESDKSTHGMNETC